MNREALAMNSMESAPHIEENVPLAPFTTIGIGGPARFLVKAKSEEHVLESLRFAQRKGCPLFVLGGGSNLVVSDSGFPGLVVKVELQGTEGLADGSIGRVSAMAGEEWDALVGKCVDRRMAGVECLSGIPGTVGATPVQNVGAYGQECSNVIRSVCALDRKTLSLRNLSKQECHFAYRTSIFNTADRERFVILKVDYDLLPEGEACVEYQDLRRHFGGHEGKPSLKDVRETVLRIRASKGMTLDAQDPDCKSAGSFFKNPIVDATLASALEQHVRSHGFINASELFPRFKTVTGEEKLSAAWLIERAGFPKGFTSGRAGISGKHSLALVNRGGASAQEILDLMHQIQDRVQRLFAVELQPEPIFIGFDHI